MVVETKAQKTARIREWVKSQPSAAKRAEEVAAEEELEKRNKWIQENDPVWRMNRVRQIATREMEAERRAGTNQYYD